MAAKKRSTKKSVTHRATAKSGSSRKAAAKKRNRTIIKAKRVTVLSANPRKPATARNAHRISPEAIAQFPAHLQAQYQKHWDAIESKEEKATTPAAKKKVELKRRGLLARMRTRLNVLRGSKRMKVSARDTGKCPRKKITVRARTEGDALAKAKGKLGGRRYDQFRVGNGAGWTKHPADQYGKFSYMDYGRGYEFAIDPIFEFPSGKPEKFKGYQLSVNIYPAGVRRSLPRLFKTPSAAQSAARKVYNQYFDAAGTYKAHKRNAKRRNDGSDERREQFAGKVTGHKELYFAPGTPQGLSTLGPLQLIRTDAGDIVPVKDAAYLCQDAGGRLHLGATKPNAPLMDGAARSFGKVHRVEYECRKPHLGYPQLVTWFHDFETPLPTLKADGEGGLRFVGGGYKIAREGIVG